MTFEPRTCGSDYKYPKDKKGYYDDLKLQRFYSRIR
jgi:hypothetical protein